MQDHDGGGLLRNVKELVMSIEEEETGSGLKWSCKERNCGLGRIFCGDRKFWKSLV